MKRRLCMTFLLLSMLLTGCWDRLEVEDQLFPVSVSVDAGQWKRYRVMMRVPMASQVKSGVLGGKAGGAMSSELLTAEADSITQAVLIINASVARRINLRHMRALVVGESLARADLHELFAELMRNGEVRQTVAFLVARGQAEQVFRLANFTGEANAAKLSEGILLVEKQLHLSPPIRLHHMINRSSGSGIDAFAPVISINPRVGGGDGGSDGQETALAGDLDRFDGNPVEIAGTAIFVRSRLAGFLTVDETQALLALRGEMGKAYMTIPHPLAPGKSVLVRYQQENKPTGPVLITPEGPRVSIRLIFEGEVLSGDDDYQNEETRRRLEAAASAYMRKLAEAVIRKQVEWEADPIGLGLKARRRFSTWDEWHQYNWPRHISELQSNVVVEMRIRRFGLTLGTEQVSRIKN